MFSNSKMRLATAGALLSTAVLVSAESSYDRELGQLKEQRDAAKAAVVEPIERRYQASLEQLLKRATQGGDLEAALNVKEELMKFPGANDPRNTPLELIGSWDLIDEPTNLHFPREFKPNGKLVCVTPPGIKWTINGNKLILTYADPSIVDTFDLPIKNHQMVGTNKAKHPLTLVKVPSK